MVASTIARKLLIGQLLLALWPAHALASNGQWNFYPFVLTPPANRETDRQRDAYQWEISRSGARNALSKGDYATAEKRLKDALEYARKFGSQDARVGLTLDLIAQLYRRQGKYAKAEQLYRRALAVVEKASGPDHMNVAIILNNLAGFYDARKKYTAAEPLYQRALSIAEKALEPDDPDLAAILANLAEFFISQGRYAEAEPLRVRSMGIMEKRLGHGHWRVGDAILRLAILYQLSGQYKKAAPLYVRALTILENTLGPEHPGVADTLESYASLLRATGGDADAAKMENRARTIRAKRVETEREEAKRREAKRAEPTVEEKIAALMPRAEHGDAEAQLALYKLQLGEQALIWLCRAAHGELADAQAIFGMHFQTGTSVPRQDNVEAYKWNSLALARDGSSALEQREQIAVKMSPAEIAEGEKLAAEWTPNPEECGEVAPPLCRDVGGYEAYMTRTGKVCRLN